MPEKAQDDPKSVGSGSNPKSWQGQAIQSLLEVAAYEKSVPTLLYNDYNACVRWSHNMTSKAARHIELRENLVRKWVQDKSLAVKHVAGKINPSNIFTQRDVQWYSLSTSTRLFHVSFI